MPRVVLGCVVPRNKQGEEMIDFKVGDQVVNKWRIEYKNAKVYTIVEINLNNINYPLKIVDADGVEAFIPYIDLIRTE